MELLTRPDDPPPATRDHERVAALLEEAGLEVRVARVLAYIRTVPDARSRDVQDALGLRQPEVSVATLELRNRGWVEAEPRKHGGKGRPLHHYRLAVPWERILRDVQADLEARLEERLALIEQVESLLA